MTASGVHRRQQVLRGSLCFVLGVLGSAVACGGDEQRVPPVTQAPDGSSGSGAGEEGAGATGGSGGKGATGGTNGNEGGTGQGEAGEAQGAVAGMSSGASAGANAGEGGAGSGIPENCGDGVLDAGEDCDSEEIPSDCVALGFERGDLRCSVFCTFDTAVCVSDERCADGLDNDRDDAIDCDDDECEASCESSCEAPETIAEPVVLQGSNIGHANDFSSLCSFNDPSGPEVVYAVEVAQDGVLEASVSSTKLFSVEISSDCGASGVSRGCGLSSTSARVSMGEVVYVVVEGLESADQGAFELALASRPADVCGDGYRDSGEGCDDENRDPLDGCDEACEVESTESEPNDDVASADAFEAPHYAEIKPAGDADVLRIDVPEGPAQVAINTLNFADGACSRNLMDSYLELLDESGETIASDDDGGDGFCARLVTGALASGSYFVRVTASSAGSTPEFPYWLAVSVDACGNGTLVETEECDDGNRTAGDGCDASCHLE